MTLVAPYPAELLRVARKVVWYDSPEQTLAEALQAYRENKRKEPMRLLHWQLARSSGVKRLSVKSLKWKSGNEFAVKSRNDTG
jgi:hypothetical protein